MKVKKVEDTTLINAPLSEYLKERNMKIARHKKKHSDLCVYSNSIQASYLVLELESVSTKKKKGNSLIQDDQIQDKRIIQWIILSQRRRLIQ